MKHRTRALVITVGLAAFTSLLPATQALAGVIRW